MVEVTTRPMDDLCLDELKSHAVAYCILYRDSYRKHRQLLRHQHTDEFRLNKRQMSEYFHRLNIISIIIKWHEPDWTIDPNDY